MKNEVFEKKVENFKDYRWSSNSDWLNSSNYFFSAIQSNKSKIKKFLLKIPLSENKYLILPVSKKSSNNFINIDWLYTPCVNLSKYCIPPPNVTEILNPNKLYTIFSYCIIKPILEDSFKSIDFDKSVRTYAYAYTENNRAFAPTHHEYWKNRPKQLINTVSRKRKKNVAAGCYFVFVDNLSSFYREHYWHVYNKSWKPAEASPEFINWLLDYTSEQGLLRLGFTYIDSRPIAMHFWIVQDGTASIFKLAQDKEFDHLSPGTVLMAEMIDWVYAHDEIHCIDFLTGSDDYKKLWMDECRPLYGLEIFNMKTIRGRLLWYRHCIIRFLKSIRSRFNKHE